MSCFSRTTAVVAMAVGQVILVAALGCGSGDRAEVEHDIQRNSFSYRGVFSGAWGQENHSWPVSGRRVLLSWDGTDVSAGEFVLSITDAEDHETYFGRTVGSAPAAEASAFGQAGDWRLDISYQGLEGSVVVMGTAVID